MSFQKLSLDTLRLIRPMLEERLPVSAMMLNIVNITLSRNYKNDGVDIYGFAEGSCQIDKENLFLNVHIHKPKAEVPYTILLPPKLVTNAMLEAFSLLYDWTKPQDFGAIPEHFYPHLKKIFDEHGGTGSLNPCTDMYLPMEDAIRLDLKRPDLETGFQVDKLAHENGVKVNSYWTYGGDLGEVNIGYNINSVGGVGVFKKSPRDSNLDKSNDNLVSWAVFLRLGTLNAWHTLDEYRGRGIGRWTLEAGSKFVAQQGYIPICEIDSYNQQSRRVVEKIGYKIIQDVNWVYYKPKGSS